MVEMVITGENKLESNFSETIPARKHAKTRRN